MRIIVGLTGLSGSGKTEVANCFEQQEEYSVVRLGKYLRERYWVEKREGESIEDYAERYRFHSIGEYMQNDIGELQQNRKIIIVDSLRTAADYNYFKSCTDKFILIMIMAEKQKRINWILNRRREGDVENNWKLQAHDYWEMSFGIDKLMVLADHFVINDNSIEDMYQTIKSNLKKYEEYI